jgi:transcriptional regulator with XRE-family HTH domain
MKENFSRNLRYLCADTGSVSKVCREIGINRHQFDRYLKGESLPAAYNLRKIAVYFNISEDGLFLPRDGFDERYKQHSRHQIGTPLDILSSAFSEQAKQMRRYLGTYHVYVTTPTWEGQIMCGLTQLIEQNGFVIVRTLERAGSKDGSVIQRARFDGLASYKGNRIFVVERERENDGSIVETVLYPAHRQQVMYLRGLTLGIASRPRLTPYFSRIIWKRINERFTMREAIQACGVYDVKNPKLTPAIRNFLQEPTDLVSL